MHALLSHGGLVVHGCRCWCSDAGKELLDAVAPVAGRSMVVGVGRVCGQRTGPTSCLAGSA